MTQKHSAPLGEPFKVTLTRGMKGQYGWEIEVRADNTDTVLAEISKLNMELRKAYDGAVTEGE